ncbi:MAG: PEP-CTERM sorting domain-containing protein [Calothrix sp. MO_167.B12]|nr:PEP-CTERM sorting domain-containing protein [Calothrix sp. MO_167.B12]
MYTWQKFAVTAASLALTFSVVDLRPAEAVNFNFSGEIDSGALSGEKFQGSFSYEESLVTGTGNFFFQEYIPVSNLQFDFLGETFTEADDIYGGPEVAFVANNLMGLSYNINNATAGTIQFNFSFVPGFTDISQSYFTYASTNATGGTGSVTFTKQVNGTPVPEPFTILGTAVVLGFGVLLQKEAGKKVKNLGLTATVQSKVDCV